MLDAGSRVRTCVGAKPTAPKAALFDHSSIPACKGSGTGRFINVLHGSTKQAVIRYMTLKQLLEHRKLYIARNQNLASAPLWVLLNVNGKRDCKGH